MLKSKFPDIQESIFPKISRLANENSAINLGQGYPDFEADPFIFERLNYYTHNGYNQYSPLAGHEKLRHEITKSHLKIYGTEFSHEHEVTVTTGATEAIFCAISTIINPGDEVIIFDPGYDSYNPNVRLNGGKPIHLNLDIHNPGYDWELVKSTITDKTKLIVLNTPHNPTGLTLKKNDLDSLWELIKDKDIYILSDEVYQHIIFDNKKHISPINDERFRERTFSVSSFGKSFHTTGWRLGYCIAPKELTKELRKIHQYITYCSMGSAQMAIADMMEKHPQYFAELGLFYQRKRDLFLDKLKATKFTALPCEGSYFQIVDYSAYSKKPDLDFCTDLIMDKKLAAIPISALYIDAPEQQIIRFCFAKTNKVLESSLDLFT